MMNHDDLTSFAPIDLADLHAVTGGFPGESPFATRVRLGLELDKIKAAKAAGTYVSPVFGPGGPLAR